MIKKFMFFEEIEAICNKQALNYVTMGALDGRFFKGQSLIINSISDNKEFPLCRFKCIESGGKDSNWQFDEEIS